MADATAGAGDERFFVRTGPHTLAEIGRAAGGEVRGGDPAQRFTGVSPLLTAGPQHVSFLDNRRYADQLAATEAGAVIVHPALADRVPGGCAAIVTPEPYAGWARAAALFVPYPDAVPGVHPSAVVAESAHVDPTAQVGALAVIEAGASIGARCRVGPGAVVGRAVAIGPDSRIGANASISHAVLGARVNILPGARIGQEGFGFAMTGQGFVTVPQLGLVLIEDDVEIGANTAIDRGATTDTVIGAGSRIDNLVMIGHGVQLGRCCVVVGQAGISGSTVLEDFVVVAAQAGLAGHLRMGAKARIGAQAGVMADVPAGADVVGSPAEPVRAFFRGVATLRKLSRRPKGGPEATE